MNFQEPSQLEIELIQELRKPKLKLGNRIPTKELSIALAQTRRGNVPQAHLEVYRRVIAQGNVALIYQKFTEMEKLGITYSTNQRTPYVQGKRLLTSTFTLQNGIYVPETQNEIDRALFDTEDKIQILGIELPYSPELEEIWNLRESIEGIQGFYEEHTSGDAKIMVEPFVRFIDEVRRR